ncbi:MAG: tetratricopeptide repeat protein [Candidatus Muiribacteriota bacterium]
MKKRLVSIEKYMKELNKVYYLLIFVFIFSTSLFSSEYNKIINIYIEKNDFESARRYMNLVKNFDEKLTVEQVLLDFKINKYFKKNRSEYLEYMRDNYTAYKYPELLREIIKLQSENYFNFEKLELLLKNTLKDFPENFNFSYFTTIPFYYSSGMNIMESNKYRLELKKYLKLYDDDFTSTAAQKYSFLMAFEFSKTDKASEMAKDFNFPFRDEFLWYLDFFYNNRENGINFKSFESNFFKVFFLFSNYYFNNSESLESLERLEVEKDFYYKELALAVAFEREKDFEKALYYYSRLDSIFELEEELENRVTASINRLKLNHSKEYWLRRIEELLEKHYFEKSFYLTEFLSEEKKIYYRARILFYYYNNYEKALNIINKSDISSIEIKYLKGEILFSSFQYEKAVSIFEDIALDQGSKYFESAVSKISDIYKIQKKYEKMEKFSVRLYEEHGQKIFVGNTFLNLIKAYIEIENFERASRVAEYLLYMFSSNEEIFNKAYQKLNEISSLKEMNKLSEKFNNYLRKIKSEAKKDEEEVSEETEKTEVKNDAEGEEKSIDEIKNEIIPILSRYIELFNKYSTFEEKRSFYEELINDSYEIENNTMRSIGIVGMAETAYKRFKDLDNILNYFYEMIKKSVRKDEENLDRATDFYQEIVSFLYEKDYIEESLQVIDNFYREFDENFEYTELIKRRVSLAIQIDDIDLSSLKIIAEQEPDYVDSFVMENEIFSDEKIVKANFFKKLNRSSEKYKEFNELDKTDEIFEFYKNNQLFKKISEDYGIFINEFSDSYEVYHTCREALHEVEDMTGLENVLILGLNRFDREFVRDFDKEIILSYSIENHPYEKTLSLFETFSPLSSNLLKELSLSEFSKEGVEEIFNYNKQSEFLQTYLCDIYLQNGNTKKLEKISTINEELFIKILNHYKNKQDYILFEHFYNIASNNIQEKYKEVYETYMEYIELKNRFNNVILDNYTIAYTLIDKAMYLNLYGEALDFVYVIENITNQDLSQKEQEISTKSKLHEIKIKIQKNPDNLYLLKNYAYLAGTINHNDEITEKVDDLSEVKEIVDKFNEMIEEKKEKEEEEFKKDIEEKEEKYTQEDFNKAYEDENFQKAAEAAIYIAQNKNSEYFFQAAEIYEGIQRYEEAVKNYRNFILKNPSHNKASEAQYKIGILNIAMNKLNQAYSEFQKFVRYFPEDDIYMPKIEQRVEQIKTGRVERDLEELTVLDRRPSYDEVDRFADISDDIDEIEKEINQTSDHMLLSVLYEKKGDVYFENLADYESAVDNYLEAINYNYENSSAVEKAAESYLELNEYEMAVNQYEEYYDIIIDFEERAEIKLSIIQIYFENLNDYSRALDEIEIFINDFDYTEGYYKALLYKGYIYENHYRDYERAVEEYKILAEKYESDYSAEARFNIAEIYNRYFRNYTEAKKHYEQVINDYGVFELRDKAEEALRQLRDDGRI